MVVTFRKDSRQDIVINNIIIMNAGNDIHHFDLDPVFGCLGCASSVNLGLCGSKLTVI